VVIVLKGNGKMQQNNEPKIPQCFICGRKDFKDFKELARHIVENKNTHHKSLKFAAKILTDVERLNKKQQDFSGRMPLTEEQKAARKECVRILSGETKAAFCLCPACGKKHPMKIELEHFQNPMAWRKNGNIMLMCEVCRK
jgi:hypothetical protein